MRPGVVRSGILLCLVAAACGGPSAGTSTTTSAPTSPSTTSTTQATTTTTMRSTTTVVPPTTTSTSADSVIPCPIETPSPEFDTTFYAKQCTSLGIPVLSSAAVEDVAHDEAAKVIAAMLGDRPDLVAAMLGNGLRVGIIGRGELTTDLPEYADLYDQFPGVDWNTRTRGLGATLFIPLSSAGEENLVCLGSDIYFGESIFVHEFSYTIRTLGLATSDPAMDRRIERAYADAVAAGLWEDTYATTHSGEYWAEAVQSYFDTNASPPTTYNRHGVEQPPPSASRTGASAGRRCPLF